VGYLSDLENGLQRSNQFGHGAIAIRDYSLLGNLFADDI
jgi:hypothetical protein